MLYKKFGLMKMLQRDNGVFDDSQYMVIFIRFWGWDLEFGILLYFVKYK